jgi:2-oxoisovalerate dehydrogenase E2 component (dihydrolipoyl transacylase)
MGEYIIKLPDVGEGVAEAELVEWHVKVSDLDADTVLTAVMTDKATVEFPRRLTAILWLGAEIGDTVTSAADRAPGDRRRQCELESSPAEGPPMPSAAKQQPPGEAADRKGIAKAGEAQTCAISVI